MYEINTRVDGMYTVVLSTLLVESTQVEVLHCDGIYTV